MPHNCATMPNKIEIGMAAQKTAMEFLRAKGLKLIEANFRTPAAEIDLIMKAGDYIVFVEVKYRQNQKYGFPREAVNTRKQQKIKKAALHYIARRRIKDQDFRFDVVEVLESPGGPEINHIENAFW